MRLWSKHNNKKKKTRFRSPLSSAKKSDALTTSTAHALFCSFRQLHSGGVDCRTSRSQKTHLTAFLISPKAKKNLGFFLECKRPFFSIGKEGRGLNNCPPLIFAKNAWKGDWDVHKFFRLSVCKLCMLKSSVH